MELLDFYRMMARARAFELGLADLWQEGLVSGEMHLGTGEEAIAAGVVPHLEEGDAVALDHRPTPVLLMRGVDPVAMLREALGREDGLCHGRGGHMHLFSPEFLAATSGIVGAAGPAAAGFALAARHLRPGTVAVGFFGDGAANQGMLLESLNLAVVLNLPVLFVCKQNGWAITTRTEATTGGDLLRRASGFGLRAMGVDGADASAVHDVTGTLLGYAREGRGPGFVLADCPRLDGHFLGDPLVRVARHPVGEGREVFGEALRGATSARGGRVGARVGSLTRMLSLLRVAREERREVRDDPIVRARRGLGRRVAAEVEEEAARWAADVVRQATEGEQ